LKLALLSLIFINTLIANIIIPQNIKKIHNFQINYFYDESRKETIQTVEKQNFTNTPSQFTFGHKRGDFWFQFTITNKSKKEDFILYFNEAYYENLILYTKKNAIWVNEKNGLNSSFQEHSIQYFNPAFSLNIKPNETKTYYVQGNSKLTTSSEFEIYEKEYFYTHGTLYNLLYMVYFGAVLLIFILNIFIYFKVKENVYLYYSGYILFCSLWISAYSGLILYAPIEMFFHNFLMVTAMWVMFLILFSSEFLNVKEYLPKVYKPLNIFGYVFGILAILICFSFEPWFEIMHILASGVFIILFTVAIVILKKENDKDTKYYLYAMSIYMITMTLMSAMANGWIENNDFNRYSFLYGSFFEILFFTLLLTNRFYIFQNEKIVIQKELLELKNKNEIILEQKIEDRTKQIKETYLEVKNLSQEKELLLKELYHRVKNNFHSIIGLLHIEKKSLQDIQTKEIFLKTINRIKSMSTIHEFLYENKSLSYIEINKYLEKIILEIENSYNKNSIIMNKNIENFSLSMDSAISLSMIINEIISNSIKHYKKESNCIIDINLLKNGEIIHLTIQDNGQGFDSNANQKGLGLKLVQQFSTKLPNSHYNFENKNGTLFTLQFEYSHKK